MTTATGALDYAHPKVYAPPCSLTWAQLLTSWDLACYAAQGVVDREPTVLTPNGVFLSFDDVVFLN